MKVLLLFGLVAVALAELTKFEGEKVFRLKPTTDEHVTLIKDLAGNMEVDFWSPESAELVTIDINVDIHIPVAHTSMVYTILNQSDMEHEIMIEDLQAQIEAQMDGPKVSPRAHTYTKYNSWNKIEAWMVSITSANSALMSRQVIGNTYEGRPMHLLKIGKQTGTTKPAIFLDCGIHAREWISPAFCQWFVKEAVSTYGTDSAMTSLLDQMDVYVLPVLNVDGYDYTWKSNRMWRKTRKPSSSSCVGTDLNRNFDAGWCIIGASRNPCSDTYCGSKAESEIETKNVADFIRRNKSTIKAYLTVHSYSQLLLFPYSYTYDLAADHAELMSVAQGACTALTGMYGTKYTAGPGAATIYPCAGGSDDWAYDLGVKYSFTFELRDDGTHGFLLPESQIKPTCEETMLAVKHIADYVQKNPY